MFFFNDGNVDITFSPMSVEHGYVAILNDDLDTAKKVFEAIDSPRSHWGISLVGMFNGFMERIPSYFDIRNFFEIDLDFLIKNQKIHYVEMLLSSIDILSGVNQETYKYASRVMYENGYLKTAKEYMDKSKQVFYNDPELHFMFAKYFCKEKNYKQAYFHVSECLKIIPSYYPALKLKKEIENFC